MCVCSAFLALDHRQFLHLQNCTGKKRAPPAFSLPGRTRGANLSGGRAACVPLPEGSTAMSDEKSGLQPRKKMGTHGVGHIGHIGLSDCQQVKQ